MIARLLITRRPQRQNKLSQLLCDGDRITVSCTAPCSRNDQGAVECFEALIMQMGQSIVVSGILALRWRLPKGHADQIVENLPCFVVLG